MAVYLTLKEQGRALPTIIVTAYANEEVDTIDRLCAMSIAGCLTKPFDPQDLLEIVRAIEDEELRKT